MGIGGDWASVDSNHPDVNTLKTQAGFTFAITRFAYGMYEDKTFKLNRAQFATARLPYGGFLAPQYPRPGNPAPDPDKQAHNGANLVGELGDLEFPIAVDVEFSTDVTKETGLSPSEMVTWIDIILDTLEKIYGHRSIIYTSARVIAEPMKGASGKTWVTDPLWVKGVGGTKYLSPYICDVRKPAILNPNTIGNWPQPNTPPVWGGQWIVQQYQGDALNVPSMAGTTDLNRFHILRKGIANPTVMWIQRQLSLAQTGVWDDTLETAFRKFQSDQNLDVDGIFGPKAFARLSRFPVVEAEADTV